MHNLENLASHTAQLERSWDIYPNLLLFVKPSCNITDIKYEDSYRTKQDFPGLLGGSVLYPDRFIRNKQGYLDENVHYTAGIQSALWPQLDLLLRRMKIEGLRCAEV